MSLASDVRFFRILMAFGAVTLALTALGQVASDIPRGSTIDDVIRLRGWPKGKSTAEQREIWIYDTFQVVFEEGKVVNVTPVAVSTWKSPRPSVSFPQPVRAPTQNATPR